jgi:dihydroorotate dehydrogenase
LDYEICFDALFDYVDYLRWMWVRLIRLIFVLYKTKNHYSLQTIQNKNLAKPKQKPILLKIAPDLTDEQLLDIIDIVKKLKSQAL